LVLHGPLAAVMLVARTATIPALAGVFAAGARGAPMDDALANQTLFFLNGSEIPVVYTALIREVGALGPVPRRVALLASMRLTNQITVHDDHTLVYRADGGFLGHPSDNMFRNPSSPFVVDDRVHMPDFTVVVQQVTPDGRPLMVSIRFDEPLDSAEYRFVAWKDGFLEEVVLPQPGGKLVLVPTLPLPPPPLPGEGPGYPGMAWLNRGR
jgi:hypothetical protein